MKSIFVFSLIFAFTYSQDSDDLQGNDLSGDSGLSSSSASGSNGAKGSDDINEPVKSGQDFDNSEPNYSSGDYVKYPVQPGPKNSLEEIAKNYATTFIGRFNRRLEHFKVFLKNEHTEFRKFFTNGNFNLTRGWFKSEFKLHQNGSVTNSYTGNLFSVTIPVVIDRLQYGYKYAFQYGYASAHGTFNVSILDVSLAITIGFDSQDQKCMKIVKSLAVYKMKNEEVAFFIDVGYGLSDIVSAIGQKIINTWLIKEFLFEIQDVIQRGLRVTLKQMFETAKPDPVCEQLRQLGLSQQSG